MCAVSRPQLTTLPSSQKQPRGGITAAANTVATIADRARSARGNHVRAFSRGNRGTDSRGSTAPRRIRGTHRPSTHDARSRRDAKRRSGRTHGTDAGRVGTRPHAGTASVLRNNSSSNKKSPTARIIGVTSGSPASHRRYSGAIPADTVGRRSAGFCRRNPASVAGEAPRRRGIAYRLPLMPLYTAKAAWSTVAPSFSLPPSKRYTLPQAIKNKDLIAAAGTDPEADISSTHRNQTHWSPRVGRAHTPPAARPPSASPARARR